MLGAQALDRAGPTLFSWLALATFIALAAALLGLLSPRRWEFTVDSQKVISAYIESAEPARIQEVHRELSVHMHDSYLGNHAGLKKLVVLFQIANVLLVAEVLLWIMAFATAS